MSNPRADYAPIINRRPLKLPGNARVAVWVVVGVEEWDFNAPMPRALLSPPQGVSVVPDVVNYSWVDYGLRVGFWRLKEVLDRHGIRANLCLNASICNSHPLIVDESLKSGWEMMAHGYTQRALHLEKDERDVIRRSIQTIREKTGQAPRGWIGPGLAETFNTLDILAEEGIEYVGDWANDDQPYPMKVKKGRLFSIPYLLELNDVPIYIVQHHRAPEFFERAREAFETLYEEGSKNARVMAIGVHPHIMGVPYRIRYFDKIFQFMKKYDGVLFMTGGEIVDWYKSVSDAEK